MVGLKPILEENSSYHDFNEESSYSDASGFDEGAMTADEMDEILNAQSLQLIKN